MKKLLLVSVLLLAVLTAAGQRVVNGVVADSATGAPLAYVNVGVEGRALGTATDTAGRFRLVVPGGGPAKLKFSHTGYRPRSLSLPASPAGDTTVSVALAPAATNLKAVEVSDEKTRGTAFTTIDATRLQAGNGPAEGVETLVKTLPDVNSSNELSSQFSVRGGSFDENLVYINGVEVFRPMLIRSGQQEGMSIINPDLVSFILFSPGGFDATYGDKMSSVLDIAYHPPVSFKASASLSLLGGSASVLTPVGNRFALATALRHHSNTYLLRSLDTKGAYTSSYTDLQTLLHYRAAPALDLGLLTILSRNAYGLVPESQTTAFSQRSMELDVYFDGAEDDRYRTLLTALTFDFHPEGDWRMKGNLSLQRIAESERYHIQSQYWLYQLGLGSEEGDVDRFDRGVGTFLEHSRGRLATGIYAARLQAVRQARLGSWQLGGRLQYETADDRLRRWRWVDSAGFAVPLSPLVPGDSSNMPAAPLLQQYSNTAGGINTFRATAFAQREVNLTLAHGHELSLLAGLRGSAYAAQLLWYGEPRQAPLRGFLDPRVSATFSPHWKTDILFRLAAGIYTQPPVYREYRRADGTLNPDVAPQTSYQVSATTDWNLRIASRPLKLTGDLYYKYVSDLVPYLLDNLSITYLPDRQARAYATGFSLRVNAELVDSLESWVSFHLMNTRQDILGDDLPWHPRPTDQRLSVKLFLQDYVPLVPWWRMSITLVYATGAPVASSYAPVVSPLRFPSYFRIDWGNTVHLSRFAFFKRVPLLRSCKDVQLSLQVFNLFDRRNVSSYLWVTDYDNRPYRVPSYLTARQLNLKLSVLF